MLTRVNLRKALGPDGVLGMVLRACIAQLSQVFTTIFNLSLTQSTIPACLKSATIIPVLKKSTTVRHKDYCPVALTPIVPKCLELLVLNHINFLLRPSPVCLQSEQVDGGHNSHHTPHHAESPGTPESYVRMLFIDYSSALNTIISEILGSKLSDLGLPPTHQLLH